MRDGGSGNRDEGGDQEWLTTGSVYIGQRIRSNVFENDVKSG